MRSICFYFQVHQPFRLRTFRFFDIGKNHQYYDEYLNKSIAHRVADKSYLPANNLMLDLIKKLGNDFKVSYSISGIALEQFERYTPEVIESFQKLAATGNVEFLAETYAHSLASLKSKKEFQNQVVAHSAKIEELFGVKPTAFRNTELIYSDDVGDMVADLGFDIMLTEGAKHILGWKSPNYLYHHAENPNLKLLLKNFRLSDDIAFRFSLQSWSEWPLTTKKFTRWLNALEKKEQVVNLFLDYETFGEHQWEETGIFDFLAALPKEILKNSDFRFKTPSELSKELKPVSAIHVPYPISWADEERDITAWLGNELQDEAFENLYSVEEKVRKSANQELIRDWQYLQASDHFYYMCTKWFSDGDVHKYFNPYPSPYEAFINYMNVLSDFLKRVDEVTAKIEIKSTEIKDTLKIKEVKQKAKPRIKKVATINELKDASSSRLKKLIQTLDIDVVACALVKADKALVYKIEESLGKRKLLEFQTLSLKLIKTNRSEINRCRKQMVEAFNNLK